MEKMPPLPQLPIKPPTADKEGKLPTHIDSKMVHFTMYKGMMFPCVYDPVEVQVQKVKTMELRDNDILLCTFPKCGTHWMWRVLDMLVSGKAEYSDRVPDFTILDTQSIDLVKNVPSPRVLLTHYPFDYLPEQVKKVKLVHIYRHPKAATVSMHFHMKRVGRRGDISLQQLVQMHLAGQNGLANIFRYWDRVVEFEKNNPDVSIFHLSYEDVKKDTAGSIRKLADYLQVQATDELCSQIAEAVSFENQKKKETENENHKQATFYRKGVVDDWKNYLTVAESEQYDAVIRGRANTCPFSRHYLPSA